MREQHYWLTRARRLAWRRNFAAWLALFLPVLCGVAVTGAAALLIFRTAKTSVTPVWIGIGILSVVSATVTAGMCRRRFFSTEDALTRLDHAGHLHNRLTAASAGVGDWPAPFQLRDGTRWNWPRLIVPIALAGVVLIGAGWVKIPDREKQDRVTDPPLAWGQIESWLQTLEQVQLVDPGSLQKLREQLDGLRQQAPEHWYTQSTLEASDTLRTHTEQSLKNMLNNMQKADESLTGMAKLGDTAAPSELQTMNESFQKSARGLQMGNLPLNREMLENLKKIDPSKLKQMSSEQLAAMQSKLKAGVRACEKCLGPSVRPGDPIALQPGAGGKGGGGSPAPLTLKQAPSDLRSQRTDTVSNDDMSRAAFGDIAGVNQGEHEVKKQAPKPGAAGSINSTGEGGEAVWRDTLTPEEQQVLQRFFK